MYHNDQKVRRLPRLAVTLKGRAHIICKGSEAFRLSDKTFSRVQHSLGADPKPHRQGFQTRHYIFHGAPVKKVYVAGPYGRAIVFVAKNATHLMLKAHPEGNNSYKVEKTLREE